MNDRIIYDTTWDVNITSEQTVFYAGREIPLTYQQVALSPECPDDEALLHFTDFDANQLAADYAGVVAWWRKTALIESCVYIMDHLDNDKCKIGVSSNPAHRKTTLEWKGWKPLRYGALFWTIEDTAFTLERMALNDAGDRYKRVLGEWVQMDVDEAALMILGRSKELGSPIATSQQHIRNMREQERAIRQAVIDDITEEWGRGRAIWWGEKNPLQFV